MEKEKKKLMCKFAAVCSSEGLQKLPQDLLPKERRAREDSLQGKIQQEL